MDDRRCDVPSVPAAAEQAPLLVAGPVGRWGPPVATSTTAAPRRRPPWGLGDFVLWLVIGLLLSTVVVAIAAVVVLLPALRQHPGDVQQVLQGKLTGLQNSGPVVVFGLLAMWVGFLGGPLYATYRKGARSLGADFGLRFKKFDLIWGPLIGGGLLGAQWALSQTLALFGVSQSNNVGEVTGIHGRAWLVAAVLLGSFGAPVFEELFFRGLLLRALLRRFAPEGASRLAHRAGTVFSVLVSSAVFGALHLTEFSGAGVSVAAQTGLLGVVLAVCALRFRRLAPGIGAHMTNNLVALLLALL